MNDIIKACDGIIADHEAGRFEDLDGSRIARTLKAVLEKCQQICDDHQDYLDRGGVAFDLEAQTILEEARQAWAGKEGEIEEADREHFRQHLKNASEIVATWPEWKRKALG